MHYIEEEGTYYIEIDNKKLKEAFGVGRESEEMQQVKNKKRLVLPVFFYYTISTI